MGQILWIFEHWFTILCGITQWEIFRGLLMNAIYGGHLDDDNDIEKLNIYFFNDSNDY